MLDGNICAIADVAMMDSMFMQYIREAFHQYIVSPCPSEKSTA